MENEIDTNTQKALCSLARRKPNATISIAADLANNELNSICRIALAWIADGNVHGISYLVKPPAQTFTSREITAAMVEGSPSFQTIWDTEIKLLLKNEILSAYRSEHLFLAIKKSYESSGKSFQMADAYVRDLKFLASTYIPDLGNDSFITIMHFMKIPVDLDNALSRAMACVCGLDWLEKLYPVTHYGIPLSAIMAGALHPQVHAPEPEEAAAAAEAKRKKYDRLNYYAKILFVPFLILCVFLTLYYVKRYTDAHKNDVDFSLYKISAAMGLPALTEEPAASPLKHEYTIKQGTSVVLEKSCIDQFVRYMKTNDIRQLQILLQNDKVVVFKNPTKIQIIGLDAQGFMKIKITEGHYKNKIGIIPFNMLQE